jgi:general secretion pathway protein G
MIRPTPRRRFGFTLVEMLVVIVIIGILVALLIPVIAAAVGNARNAAVTAEITTLANALTAFKEKYGDYPPSRIVLNENGFYNTASTTALSGITWLGTGPQTYSPNDLTYGQLAQRSLRYLQKFFPRAVFSTTGAIYTGVTTGWHDFNGNDPGPNGNAANRVPDGAPIYLEGHECLVFFLGGIPNQTGTVLGMDGFAKNPANPFQNSLDTTARYNSFFEFKGDRLIDDDNDGIPGYIDSLDTSQGSARYYAYFSAYGQNGYDPNDVNFADPDPNGSTNALYRAFRVNFGVLNPLNASIVGSVGSFAPNPYTTSDPYPNTLVFSPAFQNPNSFQIISAGRDRSYGLGGQYLANSTGERLPYPTDPNAHPNWPTGDVPSGASGWPGESVQAGIRLIEQDNLTNLATSKLE